MKRKITITLGVSLLMCLAGCESGQSVNSIDSTISPSTSTNPTSVESSSTSSSEPISVESSSTSNPISVDSSIISSTISSTTTSELTSQDTPEGIYNERFKDVRGTYTKSSDGYIEFDKPTYVNKNTTDYYSSVVGKVGKELKEELYTIIRGHDTVAYNGVSNNWASIYRSIDQDPSGVEGINLLYSGVVLSNTYFVREHVWPKNFGFNDYTKLDPGIDLHNLHPALSGVNSYRNTMEFDNVTSGTTNEYYGFKFEQLGDYVFDPIDASKGDIARTMFYMAVRYEGKEKVQGVIKDSPDLELSPYLNLRLQNDSWYMGNLETLLEWNELDPVDQSEIRRNELIYTSYQHNRNPFIDHPEYARMIFDSSYSGDGASNLNPTDSLDDIPLPYNSGKESLINGTVTSISTFTDTLSGISNSYKQDATITTATSNEFYITSGRKSGAFTLGLNNNTDRIDEKFYSQISGMSASTSASSIEMNFDVSNSDGILINVAEFYPSTAPNFLNDFHGWHILRSIDGGSTYSLVKSGNLKDVENFQISYIGEEAATSRYAFVIRGYTARLNITRITTYSDSLPA